MPTVVGNIARTLALHRGRQKGATPVVKSDEDVAVSGTVLKADDENRFLLLVAYSANKMPARGADGYIDVVRPETLEKAAWRFMDNGAKVGLWHEKGHDGAARVVENYIYRNEMPWVLTSPDGSQQVIKAGDWMVGVICTPDTWSLYKSARIGGASPQGGCRRRAAPPDLLERFRSDAA